MRGKVNPNLNPNPNPKPPGLPTMADFCDDEHLTSKEKLNRLIQEAEERQASGGPNEYSEHLIDEGPVELPHGNCPSHMALSSEYQMAAMGYSAAKVTNNTYVKRFMQSHMSRLRQLSQLKWKKDIDTNVWGKVDRDDVKALINFSGWGKPRSTQSTSTDTTTCTSSVTSVTAPTTATPDLGSLSPTVTTTTSATASSSVIVTSSTSTPTSPSCSKSSAKKAHYKTRKCPLCHKDQTNLPRHLETHVKRGEISRDRITALTQYVDKGDHQYRTEIYVQKKKKVVRGKRRLFKCPLCELVTAYLPTHFANKHKIPRSSEQSERYMALARAYEGREELKYIKRTRPSRKVTSVTDNRGIECLLQGPLLDEDDALDKNYTSPVDNSSPSLSDGSDDAMEEDIMLPTPHSIPHSVRMTRCTRAQAAAEEEAPDIVPPTPRKTPHSVSVERRRLAQAAADNEVPPSSFASGVEGDDKGDIESEGCNESEGDAEDEEDSGKGDDVSGEDSDEESESQDGDGDPQDNDFELQDTLTSILKMKNPTFPRHCWIIHFHAYLQSLAGKALTPLQAEQHARQILIMMQSIDPKGDDVTCITDSQGQAVWQWAKPLLEQKKKRPGTIISYLTSLEKFFKFAIRKQKEGDPKLKLSAKVVESMKEASSDIPAWRSVVRKQYKTDEWRTQLREMKTRVRPDDVKDLNTTEPGKKAIELLKKAPYVELSVTQYCNVRDFLIASLEMQNGQRPGPFETITMEDYEDAEVDEDTGTKTIYAPDHKTSTSGPAPISMSKSLSKKMAIYVEHVRSIFPNPDDSLFLTNKGERFPRGQIGRKVSQFWEKAGVRPDIRITSTRIRKMAATTTLSSSDIDKRLVHQHMTHTEQTANRNYIRPDQTKVAAAGHAILKANIGYVESDDSDAEKEKRKVQEKKKEKKETKEKEKDIESEDSDAKKRKEQEKKKEKKETKEKEKDIESEDSDAEKRKAQKKTKEKQETKDKEKDIESDESDAEKRKAQEKKKEKQKTKEKEKDIESEDSDAEKRKVQKKKKETQENNEKEKDIESDDSDAEKKKRKVQEKKTEEMSEEDQEEEDEEEEYLDSEDFGDVEKAMLADLFADEIDLNYPLTVEHVKKKISEHSGLWHVNLKDKGNLKRLMNSLRYQQKLKAKTKFQHFTIKRDARKQKVSGWLDENFTAMSEGSRRRLQWNEEDSETLESYFEKYPCCPDKSQILAHLQTPALRELRDREGVKRCYQKIKNIFKKRNR